MRKLCFVYGLIVLLATGCGMVAKDDEGGFVMEGAAGYCARIEGHGPPLTGAGSITRCKVSKDFVGRAVVSPDGTILIEKFNEPVQPLFEPVTR